MSSIARRFGLPLALMVGLAASGYGTDRKALILYFSMPERDAADAVAGASRIVDGGRVVGNVEYLARAIQGATGGDLYSLASAEPYPARHAPLIDQAAAELKAGARPKLKALGVNIDNYDVIFLGYPIWWADLPMPLYSFLESQDLRGKTIVPFSSHGGSGWAGTIETLARLLPKSRVVRTGFSVSRTTVAQSKPSVASWLNGLALTGKH